MGLEQREREGRIGPGSFVFETLEFVRYYLAQYWQSQTHHTLRVSLSSKSENAQRPS